FVRQLGQRVQSEAIIEAIVTLSKSMGFAVTAEGIETEDQLGLVKRLGCDLAQGYFFSPPVTPEQIEAILDISTTPNDSLRAAS
ncbi:MAG: EAL domain-containing protein, partial [Chthonomonadaceae bacterium]|nr:EAL domain-containing protein [Chthonomonadaceae bacterium]